MGDTSLQTLPKRCEPSPDMNQYIGSYNILKPKLTRKERSSDFLYSISVSFQFGNLPISTTKTASKGNESKREAVAETSHTRREERERGCNGGRTERVAA